MANQRVDINGKSYSALSVTEGLVQPLGDTLRLTGVQQRSDNRQVNKFPFANWWEVGLGCVRLRRDRSTDHGSRTGQHIGGGRDFDAETRFQAMITLPLLNETETHASPADHVKAYLHANGELIGLFEEDWATGATNYAVSRKYDASDDTWKDISTSDPTLDTSAATTATTSATISQAITVGTNSNRIVLVWVANYDASLQSISTMTFGGTAMTLLETQTNTNIVGRMYYLVNPPSGSGTATATFGGSQTTLGIHVAAFYNVDTADPFRSDGGTLGTDAAPLAVSATVFDDDVVVGGFFQRDSSGGVGTITAGTSQTQIQEVNDGGFFQSESSYEQATTESTSFDHSYSTTTGSGECVLMYGVLKAPNSTITVGTSNGIGVRIFGGAVHKGRAWAVGSAGGSSTTEGYYRVWSSPDGATWGVEYSPASTWLTTTVTRRNNFEDKLADILDAGNNVVVALYEDPAADGGDTARVHIGYSSDAGATWTFNSGLRIPCSTTPNISLVKFRDAFDSNSVIVPALVTSDNAYVLDLANNTYEAMLLPGMLTGTANEALAVAGAADGAIYVSKGNGDIFRIHVPSPGVIDIRNVGPQTKAHGEDGDGLVTARQGHANFIHGADPRWLFVAYGGHAASKNASIFCMDYENLSWHSFYKDSTANQDLYLLTISTESDGTPRLHAATEGASAATMFMFEEPLVSAVTGASQKFKATGYVEWSEDDLGDPHADSAVYTVRVDADGLNAAATIAAGDGTNTVHIGYEYGIDGAAWNDNARGEATYVGNFASDDKVLYLGKVRQNDPDAAESGTADGIACKTLRSRLVFYRDGTNTNTPKLKEFQVEAWNKLLTLRSWDIVVDTKTTAETFPADHGANRDSESVRTNLETVRDTIPLVAFTHGPTTARVRMAAASWSVETVELGGGDGRALGRRTGKVRFTVEEAFKEE